MILMRDRADLILESNRKSNRFETVQTQLPHRTLELPLDYHGSVALRGPQKDEKNGDDVIPRYVQASPMNL